MTRDRVDRVDACELKLVEKPWSYAHENHAAIDAHWERRLKQNPGFFNGPIHIARSGLVARGRLVASMTRTDFKSFLYWREQGYPEADALDAFGSAILRSSDGAVLLGKQRPGNINEGFAYLPGGFIDQRDVGDNGVVDIAASIAREVREETHLGPPDLVSRPGFFVVRCGPLLSIGQELVSEKPAEELRREILDRLAQDADPELADIVILRSGDDMEAHNVPPYTRMALGAIFGAA